MHEGAPIYKYARSLFRHVSKPCDGRPEFRADGSPWLRQPLIQLRPAYRHQAFWEEKPRRISFSPLKQRSILQQHNRKPEAQPEPKMKENRRMLEPILRHVHLPLQPPKEETLSCSIYHGRGNLTYKAFIYEVATSSIII